MLFSLWPVPVPVMSDRPFLAAGSSRGYPIVQQQQLATNAAAGRVPGGILCSDI